MCDKESFIPLQSLKRIAYMFHEIFGYMKFNSSKKKLFQKQGPGLVFCIIRSAIESNGGD